MSFEMVRVKIGVYVHMVLPTKSAACVWKEPERRMSTYMIKKNGKICSVRPNIVVNFPGEMLFSYSLVKILGGPRLCKAQPGSCSRKT